MKTLRKPVRLGRRLALTGACTLALSGCFGSFGAVRALWEWNDDVSSSKWVKWLVFLGLSIIPVYGLFAFADALVLNSVEFWTGSNPIRSGSNGRTITRVATADPNQLRLEIHHQGQLEGVFYCRRLPDGGLELRDASGALLSHVHEHADGSLELHSAGRASLVRLDAAAVARVSERVAQGQPVHAILQTELGERTWQVARSSGLGVTPALL